MTSAQSIEVGRYTLHREIARGGMASVYLARATGDEGFTRIVAAKRMAPGLADDPDLVAMFLDEARIASRIRHRNVVPVLDVVAANGEIVLVQEYVRGVSLGALLHQTRKSGALVPVRVALSIACQLLAGLHAVHELTDELGQPLGVIHRDVKPHNIMIALDGTARLLDFGVAKAASSSHVTRVGTYKGTLAYCAPEQLRGDVTRQTDLYSVALVLWELLTGQRMRIAKNETDLISAVLDGRTVPLAVGLAKRGEWEAIDQPRWHDVMLLEPILRKALEPDPRDRYATAAEMEDALTNALRPAPSVAVAVCLKELANNLIEQNEAIINAEEEACWQAARGAVASTRTMPGRSRSDEDAYANIDIVGGGSERVTHVTLATRIGRYRRVGVLATAAMLCVTFLVRALWLAPAPASAAAAVTPQHAIETPHPVIAPSVQVDHMAAPAAVPAATETVAAPDRDQPTRRATTTEQRRVRAKPRTVRAAPAAARNCDVPFYYEGNKKLFRVECL